MKIKKEWLEQRWVQLALGLCTALLFYLCLTNIPVFLAGFNKILGFLFPVLLGLIIAYLLHPIVEFFDESVLVNVQGKKKHIFSVVLTIIVVVVVITILLIALIPPIIESIINLVSNFSTYAKTLQESLTALNETALANHINISGLTNASGNILNAIGTLLPSSANQIGDIVKTTIAVSVGFVNFLISFILSIYFLIDAKHLQIGLARLLKALLGSTKYDAARGFWIRCNRILIKFIATDILDGIIVGVANFIFMTIMNMPFVALLSVVVGVTNLAPTFGPFVGGFIGAFLLVLVNPWYALWFVIFTIALQLVDGYMIKPKIFGDAFDVPSVWILVFIVLGGRMFGVLGILLAIPVAAIMTFLYRESLIPFLEKRQLDKDKAAD